MYFCEGIDNSPAMIRLRERHAQMAAESLADIKICDRELMVQAAVWVIAGSIILRLNITIHMYLKNGCEAINMAGLQFIPTCGRPPEYSEDLHEKFSALSQFIYLENFLFLACGWPEPTITARIEDEFKHQLRVRPAASPSLRWRVQHSLIGYISGIVQDMPVDHAHANHLAGQRHSPHTQPSSD